MDRWLRRGVLTVADRQSVESFARDNGRLRALVDRFVAGETLDDAVRAATVIAGQGMTTTLDQLGEDERSVAGAAAASAAYQKMLGRLAEAGLEPNISVKLTMLGLDLGSDLAEANLVSVLEAAQRVHGFVRVDMESSAHTAATIELVERVHERFPDEVGTVVQAYLHRSVDDARRLAARSMRLRLVKGAYAEPPTVALQRRDEIDAAFARIMEHLLDHATYPAIATHDPALVLATQTYAVRAGRGRDDFEFQMLYGVRRAAQLALVDEGWRMRVYVPFGTEWYPYFTRRIAERPANALFVLRQLVSD